MSEFEKWYSQATKDSIGSASMEECWNHQQSKIDNLESLLKEAIETIKLTKDQGGSQVLDINKGLICILDEFLDKPELKEWL